jgi:hypothetical protein
MLFNKLTIIGVQMKITRDVCKLIAEIEYIIGNECYNPNSYNGWTYEEGLAYRYPLTILDGKKETKCRDKYAGCTNEKKLKK